MPPEGVGSSSDVLCGDDGPGVAVEALEVDHALGQRGAVGGELAGDREGLFDMG